MIEQPSPDQSIENEAEKAAKDFIEKNPSWENKKINLKDGRTVSFSEYVSEQYKEFNDKVREKTEWLSTPEIDKALHEAKEILEARLENLNISMVDLEKERDSLSKINELINSNEKIHEPGWSWDIVPRSLELERIQKEKKVYEESLRGINAMLSRNFGKPRNDYGNFLISGM